jgi:hypothetical protein|tara:strand:- start:1291 stop:1620 length:330 start_codon:yes stop_codon:yes gene_type:complete
VDAADQFGYLSQDLRMASEVDQSALGPRLGCHVYCGITSEEEKTTSPFGCDDFFRQSARNHVHCSILNRLQYTEVDYRSGGDVKGGYNSAVDRQAIAQLAHFPLRRTLA